MSEKKEKLKTMPEWARVRVRNCKMVTDQVRFTVEEDVPYESGNT
ncbi:MAG: hypothetical protein ACI4EG_13125 [Fusicatenibacter sp.]